MIQEKLRSLIEEQGFTEVGFAPLKNPMSFDRYEAWVKSGQHAEMKYLERHLPIKQNPELKYPSYQSAIVFRFHYATESDPEFPMQGARVALYAQRKDYHSSLEAKLKVLLEVLQAQFPAEKFLFHTDSGPVLERDLGYQAGLGWFGKNTCLIDQKTL